MSKTASKEELLQACVQDLHAAREVAVERLPGVTGHAGPELSKRLEDLAETYGKEARQFEGTGVSLDGPENLWMAGVMDDAERDTRSIVRGVLLDTALIGAVRKGVAADSVSLETLVAVAQALGRDEIAALAQRMRERSGDHDARLRALLQEIA
jgi:ferritin-like metal-binding protein YciE